jgi:hypothetical protein
MAAAFELRAIADGGDDCRGGLGANTLDLRDPLASIVFAEDLVDLLVKGNDPPVKIPKEVVKFGMSKEEECLDEVSMNSFVAEDELSDLPF